MKAALREARKGQGRTSPNPAVGALIVKEGEVIAKGYHRRAGAPHAEIEALAEAGGLARGCTLYVTLEPCNHFGRTPPCTDAILRSGIQRVVVGMRDPNPNVKGKGCEYLSAKGLEVKDGVLEKECRILNEDYIKFVTTGRPFVIAKSALTADGWTATAKGHSKWITSDHARRFVHRLRDRVDAVMVGVGTVAADDPRLTVRLRRKRGRDPKRIILDTYLRLPPNARVMNQASKASTLLVVGPEVGAERVESYRRRGAEVLRCPVEAGKIDLTALMGILGQMSIMSILAEGGAAVMGELFRKRLIDKFFLFLAPKLLGGSDGVPMARGEGPETMDGCITLREVHVRRVGPDLLMIGYPEFPVG